uniref:DNA polymerase subunit gamma-2-like n=1 Tax=Myxine glutinosa TaxID=7769 RepID=UPI00358F61E2
MVSELTNRKLPFGLAEIGCCWKQNSGGNTREDTQLLLVWCCSPSKVNQWFDYFLRHRLRWWKKFSVIPSKFVAVEGENTSSLNIEYKGCWGNTVLETVQNHGNLKEYLHRETSDELQGRDGRRSIIPHVISATASLNQGTFSLLLDACQPRGLLDRRSASNATVLRMHPWLAPLKIAVDLISNPSLELKQLCEGLYRELLAAGLTVWPAYLNTEHTDIEQYFTRHDEMGIVFTVLVSDVTLENGTVRLRYRNTGIEEVTHLTLLTPYVQRYIEKS